MGRKVENDESAQGEGVLEDEQADLKKLTKKGLE